MYGKSWSQVQSTRLLNTARTPRYRILFTGDLYYFRTPLAPCQGMPRLISYSISPHPILPCIHSLSSRIAHVPDRRARGCHECPATPPDPNQSFAWQIQSLSIKLQVQLYVTYSLRLSLRLSRPPLLSFPLLYPLLTRAAPVVLAVHFLQDRGHRRHARHGLPIRVLDL